ncbi:MAG: hypothetical protein HRT67_13915 [Flavobacteriaceae bacterium]|nr:hypothetical protein [Flavobacteriaceae bacterium]
MMKHLIALVFLAVTCLNCKSNDNSCGKAYFGGEIINPTSEYVILSDDLSSHVDTLYLDANNRFSHVVTTLVPGLYSFVHGGEYQIAVLEPNDSIMIRLNTYDFDESLVFTGRGSKKNNFLISQYVTLDKEEQHIYRNFHLSPQDFKLKLDSLKLQKKQKLNAFFLKHPSSELFIQVANSSIDFNYNAYLEIFPFRHYKKQELYKYDLISDDFYDYRTGINYDENIFSHYYPFYNFLLPHFDNLALEGYFRATNDSIFDKNSIVYNLEKLALIDAKVKHETIRNDLLKYCTKKYLSDANTMENCAKMYNSFLSKSSNKRDLQHISSVFTTLRNIQPGNRFPNVEIIDQHNKLKDISTIIDKPTVIFFWSKAIKNHFKNSHNKVNILREEYPNINFVSFNIDSNTSYFWKHLLHENKFPLEYEYRFKNPHAAKKILAINYVNKVMVLDKDGKITSSNASMFKRDFRTLLDTL